jgi:23S rRNA pseudouridine2605 synthase
MRIQRALARAGIASRRHAEVLVANGQVQVNGLVARTGQVVDPARDRITVDGVLVTAPAMTPGAAIWLALHKPAGVMTTAADPAGRRTVFDCLPPAQRAPGLTYVGRLDYLTEGVLVLTTDGDAAHRLTHPSRQIPRTYVATVQGDVAQAVHAIRRGVMLDDGIVRARVDSTTPLGGARTAIQLTIAEGRTREVRRLCDAVGLTVDKLVRTRFGPVHLGSLPVGASRTLTAAERAAIGALV